MSSILEFFEPRDWLDWSVKILLFSIVSLAFVWFIAFVLARVLPVVKKDAELKVWFGLLIALCLYFMMAIILITSLTMHFKTLDIPLSYTVPWLLYVLIAYFLILGLNTKIETRISQLKGKRGR